MIYISAHKDFDLKLKEDTITQLKDELCIIDGGELKNDYPIPVIHETSENNNLYDLHDAYGELTRIHYIYKNLDKFDSDIIGFMQYRRYFIDDILLFHKKMLDTYDLICPPNDQQFVMCNQYNQYLHPEMELCVRLISFFKPEYNNVIGALYQYTKMIRHNMFIMRKKDFIDYCEFIFSSLDLLHKTLNLQGEYKLKNEKEYSIVAERLSNIFFIKHFDLSKICCANVKIYE